MVMAEVNFDAGRVSTLMADDDRSAQERQRLVALMELLVSLPEPPGTAVHFPRFEELRRGFLQACRGTDGERVEENFLELYAHLHMHEATYTPAERRRMDSAGGYWSHAGGLSPILKAGSWIGPGSRSVDIGAGNGLQGLLLQKLYPHELCCQIEISSAMIEIGRGLQDWLSIPEDRVEWRAADVLETPLGGWDFVYLYRPVRPEGPGHDFYGRLSTCLESKPGEVVIFSIADPLGPYLPESFDRVYSDGHLTCYRKPPEETT